jgi:hypothetical protein
MATENRNTSILDVAIPAAHALLSLSLYGLSSSLCVLHRTLSIASSSSVFAASALHYARFFFFLFFIPPPSPLFAPFLFVNYKSQLTLSFSLFLYFYLFYLIFGGGLLFKLGRLWKNLL